MTAADVIIKGSYEISKYKVSRLNEDGSILEEDLEVEYGSMPSYDGETPLKKLTADTLTNSKTGLLRSGKSVKTQHILHHSKLQLFR